MFTIHPNVHIQKVPWPGKAGFLFYGTLRRFCHDIMVVDIIHLPLLLSIRNRVIYYAQAYDMEYYDNPLLRKAIDMLYTIYFRAGKPIISMSQHLTEIFIKRYAFHNARTIKTGIDHATFYPEPNEELITSKRSNRAIVFMARGDAYRKGHDSALKVFEALDKDAAPIYFFILRGMKVLDCFRWRRWHAAAWWSRLMRFLMRGQHHPY